MRLGAAVGAALALAMAGCSADYVEGDRSTVLLLVESINDGAPVLSDVRGAGDNPDTIVNCRTEAAVSVRTKNPTQTVAPVQDVRLTRYEVSYRRSDGRGVQGRVQGMRDLARQGVPHREPLRPLLQAIDERQHVQDLGDLT